MFTDINIASVIFFANDLFLYPVKKNLIFSDDGRVFYFENLPSAVILPTSDRKFKNRKDIKWLI